MNITPCRAKRSLWLFLLLFCSIQLTASHIVGGEVTNQCLGNNWYKVVVTMYRDCAGVGMQATTNLTIRKGNGTLVGQYYLNKGPSSFINVNKPGCGQPTPNVCIETADYTLDSIYLPSIPQGYDLYNQTCCRNYNVDNIKDAWKVGSTFHSRIGGAICNNSAVFNQYPPVVLPANVPLAVDVSASDPDSDSLAYDLCVPLDDDSFSPPFVTVPFAPGYSSSNMVSANPPLTIDPVTGIISGRITSAGKYSVGICLREFRNGVLVGTVRRDYQFTVIQPWAVFGSIGASADASCPSAADGSATAVVGGGSAPYSFSWSNGANTATVNNLTAGTHSVIITDNTGCKDTVTVIIGANPAFTAGISSQTDAGCGNSGGGSATIAVSGGVAPYTVTWPDATVGFTHNNLSAGTHAVAVTDAGGCTDTILVTINAVASTLTASGTVTDELCPGSLSGAIDVTVSAGVAPYSFLWNDAANTEDRTGLPAGNYWVAITDKGGCTDTLHFTINSGVALNASFDSVKNVSCHGAANGYLSAIAANANGALKYQWSNGASTPSVSGLPAGAYWVRITDSVGCTDSIHTTLTAPDSLKINLQQLTNESCQGAKDAAISILPQGGTPPYSISWNTGATTASINGLSAGTYTVDVTDSMGCTQQSTFTVNAPGALAITLKSLADESCAGNDGEIEIGISGGTKPYTINWNNGQSDSTAINLIAGNYTVSVTDSNGCTTSASYTINGAVPMVVNIDSVLPASCGLNSGFASLNIVGGSTPYTINWSNAQTGLQATNLASGNLTAVVTDSAGCTDTISVVIPNAGGLSISLDSLAGPACAGQNNGFAAVSLIGGKAPYAINWSNGDTLTTTGGLASGLGFVTVTDANGCSDSLAFTVPTADSLTITKDSLQNVSCYGAQDGKLKISVGGGTPPYQYAWTNGATTSTLNNLTGGTYLITITDGRGCSATATYTLTEPDSLQVSLKNSINPGCGSANGQIAISVSGGMAPYTILWSDNQTDSTAVNLSAGTYSVTVTDASGCMASANYSLSSSAPISLAVDTVVPASCGMANGSATVSVTGGSGAYTISWSNSQSGLSATVLSAGSYWAVVTDSLGCTDSTSITIVNTGNLSATVDSLSSPSCVGGTDGFANIKVNGGTAPYSYSWSNGDTLSSTGNLMAGPGHVVITDARGCIDSLAFTVPTADSLVITLDSLKEVSCPGALDGKLKISISGGTPPYSISWTNGDSLSTLNALAAGSYGVTITDSRACSQSATFTISEPDSLKLSLKNLTNTSCNAASGEIAISIKGGQKPYLISWSNGQSDSTATNLTAGIYSVTVTDAGGCSTTDSFSVTEPPALVITLDSATTASCGLSNGMAAISVNGGTAPYTYSWSNGSTSDTATSLASGTHTVVVTDSAGCSDSLLITIPTTGNLAITLDSTAHVSCYGGNDGFLAVTASGGMAPYSLSWSNGDTLPVLNNLPAGKYTLTLTDNSGCFTTAVYTISQPDSIDITLKNLTNAGCGAATGSLDIGISGGTKPYTINWNNGQTDSSLTNLAGGNYSVTVTDANGCTASSAYTISAPSGVAINVDTILPSTCGGANGSATISIAGGVAPFTVNWSNGQTGTSATNLPAGSLSVMVVDSNGCTDSVMITIPNNGGLSVVMDSLAGPACGAQFGFGRVAVSGGVAPVNYQWSNGDTLSSTSVLPAGPGYVVVTDAIGCRDSIAFNLQSTDSLNITLDSLENVSCQGALDGKLKISISGGTPPYSINWTNGDSLSTLNNLGGGTYGVTVTDARACSHSATYTIAEPDSLQLSLKGITHVICNGDNDGEIAVSVSGGTAPYSLMWTGGQTDSTASNLFAGKYHIYVTDAAGCMLVDSFTVSQPDSLSFTVDSVLPASCGKSNGYVSLTGVGGTPPYRFEWNTRQKGAQVDSLWVNLYTVKVTDTNGCEFSAHVNVPAAAPFSAQIDSLQAPSCFGGNDGFASVVISGGNPPFSYSWMGGATGSSANNLLSGTAYVLISDSRGCSDSLSFSVPVRDSLMISLDTLAGPGCFGGADGLIGITASGGSAPYTYLWSNGDTTALATGLAAGIYNVTITDNNGCSTSASYQLTQPDSLSLSLKSSTDVSCNGGNDGALAISISGGTKPYTVTWSNAQTDSTVSGLTAGSYSATVTDANGCSVVGSFAVAEPAAITITIDTLEMASCGLANGGATISVGGGSGSFQIVWDNSETGFTADSLTAGSHFAVITDTNGCADTIQLTIPSAPSLSAIIDSVAGPGCAGGNDGFSHVSVNGGVPPYSYSWSNAISQNTNYSLGSGPAYVVVTDAKGCTDTALVQVPSTDSITIQVDSIHHVLCYGEPSAFMEISVSGGVEPYVINWGNNIYGKTLQNGVAGNYTVTVTDSNGCVGSAQFTITQPDSFYVIIDSVRNTSCKGATDGAVFMRASGNNTITNIQANLGKVNPNNVSELGAGKYSFWVENGNGCGTLVEFEIKNPEPIKIAAATNSSPSCDNAPDGIIELNITGGNGAPYTYSWQDGSTLGNRYDLAPGKHTVTVTDKGGCSAEKEFYVAPKKMGMSFRLEEVGCYENADARLEVNVTGAAMPYILLLNNEQVYNNQKVMAGHYTLTLIDADSCTVSKSIVVEENSGSEMFFATAFTPNNDGLNDTYELKGSPDCLTNARLEIFNRWGARIFATDRPFEEFWDGTVNGQPAKADIYMYSFTSDEKQAKGYLNVLK